MSRVSVRKDTVAPSAVLLDYLLHKILDHLLNGKWFHSGQRSLKFERMVSARQKCSGNIPNQVGQKRGGIYWYVIRLPCYSSEACASVMYPPCFAFEKITDAFKRQLIEFGSPLVRIVSVCFDCDLNYIERAYHIENLWTVRLWGQQQK